MIYFDEKFRNTEMWISGRLAKMKKKNKTKLYIYSQLRNIYMELGIKFHAIFS